MDFTSITKDNYNLFQPLLSYRLLSEGCLFTGAVVDQSPAGAAVFSACGDVLSLDYLYVPAPLRRQGIGKALLQASLEEIRKLKDIPLHVSFPEYRHDLMVFFESLNFRYLRDGDCFTSPLTTWLDSKALKALYEKTEFGDVVCLTDLTFSEREQLEECLRKEDLDPGVLDYPEVDKASSFVEMDQETGEPEACILVETSKAQLSILLLANFSHQPEDLLALFSELSSRCGQELPIDSEVVFLTMDEGMKKLALKLAEDPADVKPLGSMISLVEPLDEACGAASGGPSLYKCFSDLKAREALKDSWLLKIRLPENTAEKLPAEEAAEAFRSCTFARSQFIKRGMKFFRKAERQLRLYDILKELPPEPPEIEEKPVLSVFEYASDKEFLDRLPTNYPLLQGLLKKKDAYPDHAALLEEISEAYENQIALMKSPYYVLLAGKSVEKFSEKHLTNIRKNLELEKQKDVSSPDVSPIEKYLRFLERSRKENVFGKGKKVKL